MSYTNERTKVVIIDDDHAMTDLLKVVLEPAKFEVHTASSGSAGIEAVKKHDPDAVILDLILPTQNGLRVCREIRRLSQVPVLVLSVVNKPGIIEQALDAGADEYLIKPVSSNVLMAHLNTLVRRARVEREAANLQRNSGVTNGQIIAHSR